MLGFNTEGRARAELDDHGWGWNVGLLVQPGPSTRAGISVRSKVEFEFEGQVDVAIPVGAMSSPALSQATFPESTTLGVAHSLNDKWQVLGGLVFTKWSRIKSIDIVESSSGQLLERIPFELHDTWRVAGGVNYRQSPRWMFRAGLAYDESPVEDAHRTVRLPDSDRYWITFGARYASSKAVAIDVAYAHLFFDDAPIHNTSPSNAPLA